MNSEAQNFYEQHVLPSINDWMANETEIHKAMLVATNLSHMADHYWKSYSSVPSKVFGKQTFQQFRDEIARISPDFTLIRDVCDAHKHASLNRSSKQITNSDQTVKGKMGFDEAKWDDGRWDSPDEIIVTDDSGSKHHFIGLVNRTRELWERLLS